MKKSSHRHFGITIVELVVGFIIAGITVLCIGFFLADNQRCYGEIYRSAFPDAAQDELVVKAVFNKTVRQASSSDNTASVGSNGEWLEVQYYSDPAVSTPDQYALFYTSEGTLFIEKGVLEPREQFSSEVLCDNVNAVTFNLTGKAAQMYLDFDDGAETRRINISAVMRNP